MRSWHAMRASISGVACLGTLWLSSLAACCGCTEPSPLTQFIPAPCSTTNTTAAPQGVQAGVVTEYAVPTAQAVPLFITSGPDGNLWFTESHVAKIGRITPDGQITEYPLPTGTTPIAITTGADGNLWFTAGEGGLGKITPDGHATLYPVAEYSTVAITAGPDGNLWFTAIGQTDITKNEIGTITPEGQVTAHPLLTPQGTKTPLTITTGPDGNLWFTEYTGHAIGRITTQGQITEMLLPTAALQPTFIKAGPQGDLWFSEENDKGTEIRVAQMTLTGQVTEYPAPSQPPANYTDDAHQLGDLAFGVDGALWFSEYAAGAIATLKPNSYPHDYAIGASDMHRPSEITLGPDGAMWFTEPADNRIGRMTTTQSFREFPTHAYDAITHDGAGNIWFTETNINKVGELTLSGLFVEYPLATGSVPRGITCGPDGGLWFGEVGKIGRIDATGTLKEFPLPDANVGVARITAGSDGNLWFIGEQYGDEYEIGKMTPTGVVTVYPQTLASNVRLPDITARADGTLWFTQQNVSGNINAIGSITTAGAITTHPITTPNIAPMRLTISPQGELWFTGSVNYQEWIGETDNSGNFLGAWPVPGYTPVVGSFVMLGNPSGITHTTQGALYFTSLGGTMVGLIRPTGYPVEKPLFALRPLPHLAAQPGDITLADDALWVVEDNTGEIAQLDLAQ